MLHLLQKRDIDSHSACPFSLKSLRQRTTYSSTVCSLGRLDTVCCRPMVGLPSPLPAAVCFRTGGCLLGPAYPSIFALALTPWSSWSLWLLWKEQNSRVFDSALSSVLVVIDSIHSEGCPWSGFAKSIVWHHPPCLLE